MATDATNKRIAAFDKLINYQPNNAKLLAMHKDTSKTRLILGGKRSGKTTFGIVECAWAALGIHPYLDYPPPPLKIRICSVDLASGVKGIILPMLYEWIPRHAISKYWSDDRVLELTNGTLIDMKSYEMDLIKFEGVERHLCFDLDTEILSKKGWAGPKDLNLGEEILTFNQQTEKLEWKPLRLIFVKDNDKALVWLHNSQFDAVTTEDHRWVVYPKKQGKLWTNKVITTSELSKNHKIPLLASYNYPTEKIYSDELVILIGWIIGNGSYPKNHLNIIRVYQSLTRYPEKCDLIRALIKKVFGHEHSHEYITPYNKEPFDGKMLTFVGKGDMARLIRTILPEKKLTPNFLYQLPKDQLIMLYEALINSDGFRHGNDDYFSQQNSKGLPEFQILCLLLGFKSRQIQCKDGYGRVHISRSTRYGPFVNVGSLKKDYIMKDQVWCVNTENETVVAKRNGTIYITANCWMDEEPPKDIYQSNYLRTISKNMNGKLLITCTPLHGMTWLYNELYDNPEAKPPYVSFCHTSIYENPHLSKESIDGILKDPAMKDNIEAAVYGKFFAHVGLVYPEFDVDKHTIKSVFPIPDNWLVVMGLDPHNRNPHGVVLCGLTPDNVWIVFDEVLQTGTINDLVKVIKTKLDRRFPPNLTITDTSANEEQSLSGRSTAEELRDIHKIYILPAHKDVTAGRLMVSSLLNPGLAADGKQLLPKLYVTENCVNLIREFRHYIWDDWVTKRREKLNFKEAPLKKDDHLLDALRYVVMTNIVYRHPGMTFKPKLPAQRSNVTGYY